jgi:hypothetical protein
MGNILHFKNAFGTVYTLRMHLGKCMWRIQWTGWIMVVTGKSPIVGREKKFGPNIVLQI